MATRTAPDFTLPGSDGSSVTLSALRGKPVLLYFSEGAGCDACLVQMQKIEQDRDFAAKGITVVPIVSMWLAPDQLLKEVSARV